MGARIVIPNFPTQASMPGSRHGYWIDLCPKHGQTDHLSYLGGACARCHHEGLEAQGLIDKDSSSRRR